VAELLKLQPKKPQYDFSVEIPPAMDPHLLTNYVGAVVALDYGFWRINASTGKFEVDFYQVDGKPIKGATFLWTKSKALVISEPSFFTPAKLASLSQERFTEWLRDDSGKVPFKDPEKRLELVRDYGNKLGMIGSLHKLYLQSPQLSNILMALENFSAYRDAPLYKKAHLVCKILQRIKLWNLVGSGKFPKIPPIDYHLMNMAWKLGIVQPPETIDRKFQTFAPLNIGEELAFRTACAGAYIKISKASGIDPYNIDDVMWMESRLNCQIEPYRCDACAFNSVCQKIRHGFPVVDTPRY
jgi:hypothetical protein